MHFRVSYKEDLSERTGADAARRWTVDRVSESHQFIDTLHELINDASRQGHEITRVVIEHPQTQAV